MKNMAKVGLITIMLCATNAVQATETVSASVMYTNAGPGIVLSYSPAKLDYPGFFIGIGENKLNRTWNIIGLSGTTGFYTFGVGAHSLRYNRENCSRTTPVAFMEFGNKKNICIQGLFGMHIYGISIGIKF